jgi:heat shock protein HslJ
MATRTALPRLGGHLVRSTVVAVGIGSLVVLSACGSASSDGPAATVGPPLEGTPWQVVAAVDEGGERLPVPGDVSATVTFEEGTASGSGGCNRWSAPYELDGSALTIGDAAATMMACPGAAGEVEAAFLGALPRVATWVGGEEGAELLDGSGETVLELTEAEATAFTGTTWVATMLNNGREGVESVLEGSEATAEFDDEGRVAGSSGCNRYTGPYTLDGETIQVGDLAGTRMACADPGLTEQEELFLTALEQAAVARVDGDTLELRDGDGDLLVSFTAGP